MECETSISETSDSNRVGFPLIGFSDLAVLVTTDQGIWCKIEIRQDSRGVILKRLHDEKLRWRRRVFPNAVNTLSCILYIICQFGP